MSNTVFFLQGVAVGVSFTAIIVKMLSLNKNTVKVKNINFDKMNQELKDALENETKESLNNFLDNKKGGTQ
jgi:hypothetical protein